MYIVQFVLYHTLYRVPWIYGYRDLLCGLSTYTLNNARMYRTKDGGIDMTYILLWRIRTSCWFVIGFLFKFIFWAVQIRHCQWQMRIQTLSPSTYIYSPCNNACSIKVVVIQLECIYYITKTMYSAYSPRTSFQMRRISTIKWNTPKFMKIWFFLVFEIPGGGHK